MIRLAFTQKTAFFIPPTLIDIDSIKNWGDKKTFKNQSWTVQCSLYRFEHWSSLIYLFHCGVRIGVHGGEGHKGFIIGWRGFLRGPDTKCVADVLSIAKELHEFSSIPPRKKISFKVYCCIHKQKESSGNIQSLFLTKVSGMQ